MSSVLKLEQICKSFKTPNGELTILRDIDLEISAGERVAIIGQSGSGKSTFLHIAGLLDEASSGTVFVEGEDASPWRDQKRSRVRNQNFGFVYQHHHLMRDFTALENVIMPMLIGKKAAAQEHALQLLEKVGLGARVTHVPAALSGGEQQRVAIARALANRPKVLLADEPTGNLDPDTAKDVSKLLNDMVKTENMASIVVTHSPELAKKCDTIYQMNKGTLVKK